MQKTKHVTLAKAWNPHPKTATVNGRKYTGTVREYFVFLRLIDCPVSRSVLLHLN